MKVALSEMRYELEEVAKEYNKCKSEGGPSNFKDIQLQQGTEIHFKESMTWFDVDRLLPFLHYVKESFNIYIRKDNSDLVVEVY